MSDTQKPMAHEEAEKMKAVESYLLNELSEEQRARFEEHYFECAPCADAVVAGQTFVHGIRPISDPVPWWKDLLARLGGPVEVPLWRLWILGATTAAALAVIGVQRIDVTPVLANTELLAKGLVKGPKSENVYAVRTPSATVEMNLYDAKQFPFYRISIAKDKGGILSQVVPAPANESERRLSVQVKREALGTGTFTVTVEGMMSETAARGSPVETYYFAVAE